MDKQFSIQVLVISTVVALILGFFIGQNYTEYKISKAIEDAFSFDDDSSEADSTNEAANEDIILAEIGDSVELATIDVTVTSWEEIENIIVAYGDPVVPSEGAKLIKVSLTVVNTANEEFTLGSSWTGLETIDGKLYTEHDDSWDLDDYIGYENLNPDIPVNGSILFEISDSSEDFSLILKKAGTNDVYKISLD